MKKFEEKITSMQIYRHIAENEEVDREYIIKYVEQQQAKEERAKKEHELLDLYRKSFTKNISNTNYEEWIVLENKIKALEEELK